MTGRRLPNREQRGATMIEVLVTLVILTLGLFGLTALQARLQVSEVESYQRAQALILLNDMANRLAANRVAAATYVTVSALGTGANCAAIGTDTRRKQDATEWCEVLQGAAETSGGGNVGAMIGARGCVESLGSGEYMITVAWQGMAPIAAPPASVGCGSGAYNMAGTTCVDDLCRRVVTTVVRIAGLS